MHRNEKQTMRRTFGVVVSKLKHVPERKETAKISKENKHKYARELRSTTPEPICKRNKVYTSAAEGQFEKITRDRKHCNNLLKYILSHATAKLRNHCEFRCIQPAQLFMLIFCVRKRSAQNVRIHSCSTLYLQEGESNLRTKKCLSQICIMLELDMVCSGVLVTLIGCISLSAFRIWIRLQIPYGRKLQSRPSRQSKFVNRAVPLSYLH